METSNLKKFAQFARRSLITQVSSKLKMVLADGSAARRENIEAIKKLEEAIKQHDKNWVIERVSYILFNRFCALRFMDVNRYTRIGVVSPAEGQFQPEILAEAKMGHIDTEMITDKTRQQVFSLLDGKSPSRDPQGEAYRLLVVGVCNDWHKTMPFLFESIDDYTELLMPDDLLSGNSILAYTREAMTSDACQDVEVIGWLYQFYISEKKDEVFDGLKKNKKITPENIPAATQLFTPRWIVRYLVENSLGRLWMLNHPKSRLIEQMDYYIKPEQPETDFLRISKPEDIKICDPACGSGHMLTYAFDLLYAIYEEEGYESAEIPEKILTHNLYGIEIDERAGELAAFALTMKARAKQRRFFSKPVQPNICVLENIHFEDGELKDYMDFVGRDLFTAPLQETLRQFEEADNFGSLIRPDLADIDSTLQTLEVKDVSGQMFLSNTHQKVLLALHQADYLSPKYHVVIANPPYMGGKSMSGRLAAWLKDNYPDVKSDLFSAFIVRNSELALQKGQLGFMSPFVWMFISSYEKLRSFLISHKTITSLIQLEYSGFEGATVPICAFTLENAHHLNFKGAYIRLSDFRGAENQAPKTLEAIKNHDCGWFYRAAASDFRKIPGSPIAYWVGDLWFKVFRDNPSLGGETFVSEGVKTGNNERFLRFWHEVSESDCGSLFDNNTKWVYHHKGGEYRKWAGNQEYVILWEHKGGEIKQMPNSGIQGEKSFLIDSAVWSDITSGGFSARNKYKGHIFDSASPAGFLVGKDNATLLSFLNSAIVKYLTPILNPTFHFKVGNFRSLPFIAVDNSSVERLIEKEQADWDSYETSWDFTSLPLLQSGYRQQTLKATYEKLRAQWQETTLEMQRLEEENNGIFIDAYGLQDELKPDVPCCEITLTCNPHYRYDGNKSEEELEALLLADTMRELISYAVGCMFGRYSLEKSGLILANQGETFADYMNRVPEPSFPADDDNVIPILDGNWFTDDISERFRKFLRIAFGEEHYEANLNFIENAIGKDIRKYFLRDFYNDHVKRYKKRPIYWLFSSPNGSFNALIYMHRYRPDTVSVVLNDYLREFRTKLSSHLDHLKQVEASTDTSKGEKVKALKEIEDLKKTIDEMITWEREILYPMATQQVEIDLDDGVKVNYVKLGVALKKIPGLDSKQD
jgi:type II restriction/modification system DNA methylase subunit YeeA